MSLLASLPFLLGARPDPVLCGLFLVLFITVHLKTVLCAAVCFKPATNRMVLCVLLLAVFAQLVPFLLSAASLPTGTAPCASTRSFVGVTEAGSLKAFLVQPRCCPTILASVSLCSWGCFLVGHTQERNCRLMGNTPPELSQRLPCCSPHVMQGTAFQTRLPNGAP